MGGLSRNVHTCTIAFEKTDQCARGVVAGTREIFRFFRKRVSWSGLSGRMLYTYTFGYLPKVASRVTIADTVLPTKDGARFDLSDMVCLSSTDDETRGMVKVTIDNWDSSKTSFPVERPLVGTLLECMPSNICVCLLMFGACMKIKTDTAGKTTTAKQIAAQRARLGFLAIRFKY